MTLSKTHLAAAAVATVLGLLAVSAGAVEIKHTNRVAGDPDRAAAPAAHGTPPTDTTEARRFDKLHHDTEIR